MSEIAGLPAAFSARPIDPATDVAPVAALCNAASQAEHGIDELDETMQAESYRVPGFDPARDGLVVHDAGGTAIATAEFWDTEDEHVSPYLYLRIHPDLVATDAGAAIGAAINRWADRRAAGTVAQAVPGARVVLASSAAATNRPMQQILEAAGFEHVRSSWQMEIELSDEPPPPPAWPAGIAVRSPEPGEDDHAVHAAVNEAFSDHYGFLSQAYDEWHHFETQVLPHDPALWLLAMDGGEIAGFSLNAAYRPGMPDVGWIGTLGVRRPWRRRGLGEALLRESFRRFHARGTRRVGLGVDASNLTGATRLYERVGMHVARESRFYQKELRAGRELRTIELAAEVG